MPLFNSCTSQDSAAILVSLKACARQQNICHGSVLHAEILRNGWLSNIYAGNALINLYAKCGALARAQQLIDELVFKSIVSWTTLISGYCQHGQGYKALSCFNQMQLEGFAPNGVTYLCVLMACGSVGASRQGEEIHDEIARKGLLVNDHVLGTALVDMYAKCGALSRARKVFEELSNHDIVSWNVLIAGYVQHGYADRALSCFQQLRSEGFLANSATYDCVLRACGQIRAANRGKQIHIELLMKGLLKEDRSLGAALVEMYSSHGELSKAKDVFEELPTRDVFCWNVLIGGHCREGHDIEVINLLDLMKLEGVLPNEVTFANALGACARIGEAQKGKELHDEIVRQGLLGMDSVLQAAVVDMYVTCGSISKAHQVLDEYAVQDVVTWNAVISACVEQGHCRDGLDCFEHMKRRGISPNNVTYACLLKACGMLEATEEGIRIHLEIIKGGLLETEPVLGNALIDMYGKCGALERAQEVFDQIQLQDVVSWTSLIAGYSQHGQNQRALLCFQFMKHDGFVPDAVTFSCVLSACRSLGDSMKAKEIHEEISREALLEKDFVLTSALLDTYAQCGAFSLAHQVLDMLSVRTVEFWNVLVAGYCEHGLIEEALGCFERIKYEGLLPDSVSFMYVLRACGSAGACGKGEEIHCEMVREGLLRNAGILGSALVDMYAKCGELRKAQAVFEELSERDVVSWTALMAGYAHSGRNDSVLDLLQKMIGEGIQPNIVTLLVMLSACSYSGLINEAQGLFEKAKMCGVSPAYKHHTCMVALLGRAGSLSMALDVIKKMPSSNHLPLWFALLNACCKWGDVGIARLAFERAAELDANLPYCTSA